MVDLSRVLLPGMWSFAWFKFYGREAKHLYMAAEKREEYLTLFSMYVRTTLESHRT